MITASDPVMGRQRISRNAVPEVMGYYAASSVLNERDPREYFDVCVDYNIDTLFCLAMFQHESQMGKNGTATQTHSWGNTRLPSFGVDPVKDIHGFPVLIQGRSGSFPQYANWRDGLISTAARLTDPTWYYRGRTIGEVFLGTAKDDHTWAPAGDMNDPNGYLASVLSFMNAHSNIDIPNDPSLAGGKMNKPSVVSLPSPNRGGYQGTRREDALVLHITQGTDSRSWLCNPASDASANYLIERDGTIYELVPPDESAWANGVVDNPNTNNALINKWLSEGINFNQRTISIEHEGFTSNNHGGSLSAAQTDATIRLQAWLCSQFNIAPDQDHILGHYEVDSVNRPFCPGFSAAEWNDFVTRVAALVNNPPAPISPPPPVGPDKGALLKGAYAQIQPWVVGLMLYEATADLSELGLPNNVQCLVCEKSVLWTDGQHIDCFHRGQYEGFVARGKVSEWR